MQELSRANTVAFETEGGRIETNTRYELCNTSPDVLARLTGDAAAGDETSHRNFFLCGGAAIRGGAVSGTPGHSAAMEVLGR
jgi:hypothetical protein